MPAFLSSKPGQTIFFLFFLSFFLFPVPDSRAMDDPDMMLEKATDLKARGYYGKAVLVLEKVLDLQKNRLGDGERANILDQLGELYYLAGQYGQAKPVLEKALSIRLEALGPEHLETAQSLLHLGVFCTLMAKYEDADRYLGDALEIRKKAFGEEHPAVAEILLEWPS